MNAGARAVRRRGPLAAAGLATCLLACSSPAPTSREALEDATYLTTDGTITLEDGEARVGDAGGEYRLYATAEGDLDLDGEVDAVAVLVEFEGMKEYVRLHALLSDGRRVEDVSARLLGERVAVQRLSIDDGLIRTDLLVRQPGEPITVDPSIRITTYHALAERGLTPVAPVAMAETAETESGEPSVEPGSGAALTLFTHEWRLASIRMGDWTGDLALLERVPTLRFVAELADPSGVSGKLAGDTGCNRFFGSFRAEEDATFRIAGLGMTRRACPGAAGDFEQRLASALGSTESYSLEAGTLEIRFVGGTLTFEAAGVLLPAESPAETGLADPEARARQRT